MSWIAVDECGDEFVYNIKPSRVKDNWDPGEGDLWFSRVWFIQLPNGSSQKLTGKQMTWDDEPVELKII